jgi:7-cyano-7-deazaguanine synthase in queuosine biosynthesis
MANERAILCGSVSDDALPFKDPRPLRLRMWGPHQNVHLTIQDVRQAMVKAVPAVFLDLIDIAVYVYCADQAITRGGDGVQDFGENWRRNFFFRIPVRNPKFWKDASVLNPLLSTLSFLSEDEYHFEFEKMTKDPSFERYLEFDSTPYDGIMEEVVMFSGGIDSLSGAVQEAVLDKRKVILVNHRSTDKLTRRHSHLLNMLDEQAKEYRPLHLPVRINKAKNLGHEYTQRTRSFLYASLGATIATMLGLNRLRFYENGIVSLNLPPSPQVVGSRATRTTHPQVLKGFSNLLSCLAGKTFTVENPFLWKTKTEVVRLIADAGCGKLLMYSTSCTHTWEITKQHTHCGTCSQCLDRRFAVLAASQEGNDPGEAYRVDLLVGERRQGTPRTMLAAYLETTNEIEKMNALQFFSRFGEASRVLRHLNGNPDATGMQIFDLHRRHAKQVTGVIDQAFTTYGPAIRKRELPASCLLRLVYDSGPSAVGDGTSAAEMTRVPQPVCVPKNYICRKGKCWAIRFDGKEERVYTPDIGFDYLQILLDHPGTQFSASKLDCVVRRRTKELVMRTASRADFSEEEAPITDGLGADNMFDDEGYENLSTRLAEIEELLPALRESDLPTRLDEIEELEIERAWITSMLGKAYGLKGRMRQLGDERNRVRNRVCNAIRRTLKQVKEYDAQLREHLVKPVLNLGHTLSYVPRDGMSWSLSADCTS